MSDVPTWELSSDEKLLIVWKDHCWYKKTPMTMENLMYWQGRFGLSVGYTGGRFICPGCRFEWQHRGGCSGPWPVR